MSDQLDMQTFANDAASALQAKIGRGVIVTARTFGAFNDAALANLYPPDTTMLGFDVRLTDGRLWRCVTPIGDNYNPIAFAYGAFMKAIIEPRIRGTQEE